MSIDATLVVIAGGRGARMGGPKSGLTFGGKPALRWIADRLDWPGPTLLVTAPSNRAPPGRETFDTEVVDPTDDGGPLLGLLTGLAATRTALAVFVPVDMPLLTRPQLAEVVNASSDGAGKMCVRQRDGSQAIEPFPCVLPTASLDALRQHWAGGRRSLRSLLDTGLCEPFDANDWPDDAWQNVNVPTDLDAVAARIAGGA